MKVALAWIDPGDPTDRAVALGLARALRALGQTAVIVGPRRRREDGRREQVEGVEIRRVGPPLLAAWPFLAFFFDAWSAAELLWLQRRQGFDLWHCHVFARPHRALAWAAAWGRFPLLASLHLVLPDYLASAGGHRGLKSLLRLSFHVTAASSASLDDARRLFPEIAPRSSVVRNGMTSTPPDGSQPLPEGPYALSASRLAPYKGLDVLLMAFAKLAGDNGGLRLVLCGRDQMRGGLARFARVLGLEGKVSFEGSVSPARLRRLLDGCLFFALPSRRENLPLALLEAMAAGKPVVASNVGGIPEVVTDGRDGLLVAPGDAAALGAAMDALCRDAGLRERLAAAARQRSLSFSWDRAARDYVQLYAGR